MPQLNRRYGQLAGHGEAEAFRALENSLTKAVNVLTGLLDTNDSRLKRLVCNDIIDHILQRKEIEDLDKRLTVIEQRLDDNRN
jgi:hypothetical protein